MGRGDLRFVGSAALARMVATGFALVRALVTTILAIRLFGSDLYGLIAYGLSAVDVVGSIVGGLPTATLRSVTRMRVDDDEGGLHRLFSAIGTVVLATAVVGGSLIVALLLVRGGPPLHARLLLGAGLGLVLVARFTTNQVFAVAQGMRRAVAMEVPRFVLALAQTAVVVTLFVTGRPSLSLFGAGLLVAGAVGLAVSWLVVRAVVPAGGRTLRLSPRHAYHYTREGVPYALSGMAISALVSFDVVALGLFRPSGEVGRYQPAMRIESALLASPMTFLATGFLPAAIEIHSRGSNQELFDLYAVVSKIAYTVTFPFAIVLAAFPTEILQAVVGKQNSTTPEVIWVLIGGSVLELCFGMNTGAVLAACGRRTITTVYAVGFAAMISLTLVLVPFYGQLGAAVALGIAGLTLNVALSTSLYRETGIHPLRLDMLAVALSSSVVASAVLVAVHLLASWSLAARIALAVATSAAWVVFVFGTRLVRVEDVRGMLPGRRRAAATAPDGGTGTGPAPAPDQAVAAADGTPVL